MRLPRVSFVARHEFDDAPSPSIHVRGAGATCSKHRVERLMRKMVNFPLKATASHDGRSPSRRSWFRMSCSASST